MKITKILQQLVCIQSYSGQEEGLVNFVVDFAQKHKLPVKMQDKNVVIYFSGKNNKKALIFNTHMDTVNCGDRNTWRYPPFGSGSGIVKNGKLYGLGASDAKASITAFLLLALDFAAKKPPIDIFVVFVTKEEFDGSGSKSFVSFFKNRYIGSYKRIAAIIGEPTDCKTVEIGHRGNVFIKITTTGDSGHSARPELIRKHAIEEMIKAILSVKKLEQCVKKTYRDKVLGTPSFTVTGIQSTSSSFNKTPNACSSTWDMRTTPKLHPKLLSMLKRKLGKKYIDIKVANKLPCGFTDPDEEIVGLFQKIAPGIGVTITRGSNDSCFFTQSKIPAVVFGPGTKKAIHKKDEYVVLESIPESVAIYKEVIGSF